MATEDFQKEMSKLVEQIKVNFKSMSKRAGVWAEKSEHELVRASKIGKVQLDIMGCNLQKEKIYYELGKKIASLRGKRNINVKNVIQPYFNQLRKIETEIKVLNKAIETIKKESYS